MKIKNNNGFTLVELIITIAIMLSLLGIAMVSFINISSSKKSESWSGVKEQVKTAAEQYFSSNEYLINEIKSNNGYAFVSVGTLVKEDYLNRVINPKSGNAVNWCDLIQVKKKISGIGYEYLYCPKDGLECSAIENADWQDTDKCDNYSGTGKDSELDVDDEPEESTTTTQAAGCPIFTYSGGNKVNGWYYGDVTVTADDGTKCILKQTGKCQSTKNPSCYSNMVKIDKTSPSISINAYKNTGDSVASSNNLQKYSGTGKWYNKYAFVEIKYNAGTSGLKSKVCTDVRSDGKHDNIGDWRNVRTEGTTTINCTLTTKSGKKASASYVIKLDRTKPICDVKVEGENKHGKAYEDKGWYTSNVTITGKCSDTLSGCKDSSVVQKKSNEQKYEISPGIVYDKAGNSRTCGKKTFGIDKTAPTCSVSLAGTKGNKVDSLQWYTSNVTISGKCSDTVSGCKDSSVVQKKSNEQKYEISPGIVYDKAGNSRKCDAEAFAIDKTKPACSVSLTGTKGNKVNDLQWYTSNVTITGKCSDTVSGCEKASITGVKSNEQRYANLSPGIVYDKAGNSITCGKKTFAIDKTAPSISYQEVDIYDNKNSYCGNGGGGARTEYTVEDKVSGIQEVHDYYTPKYNESHLTNVGTWRVKGRTISSGINSHFSNIEKKAVDSVLSKVSYKDIWTKIGNCKSGNGIDTGNYYHKERACDVAGNCVNSISNAIKVN